MSEYKGPISTPFSSGLKSAPDGVLLVDRAEAVNTSIKSTGEIVLGSEISTARLVHNTSLADSPEVSVNAVQFFSSPPSADWAPLQLTDAVSDVTTPALNDSPSPAAASLGTSDSLNSATTVADASSKDMDAAVSDALSLMVDKLASNEAQSDAVDQALDELLDDVSAAVGQVQHMIPADSVLPAILPSDSQASPDSAAESHLVLTGSTARPALAELQLPVTLPGSSAMAGSLVKAKPSMAKVQSPVKAGAAGMVSGSEWWQHKSSFQEMAAAVPTQHSQVSTQMTSLL